MLKLRADNELSNYVICCWSGHRRFRDIRREQDPTFYVQHHIKALQKYKHNLNQITLVVPHNPEEPRCYRDFLNNLPKKIQNADVVVQERPNLGMSYGSFSDCYGKYRTQFAYYFFIEDDGMFVQGNFDQLHIRILQEDPKCGYICGMVWNMFDWHAGISAGCMRTAALEAVWLVKGRLPHGGTDYSTNQDRGQVGQSQAIRAAGYTLRDWQDRYRIGFRHMNGAVTYWCPNAPETLLEPI